MYTAHLPSSLHKRPPPQSYMGQNEIKSIPTPPWSLSLHAGTTLIPIDIVFIVLPFFLNEVNFCLFEMNTKQEIKIGEWKRDFLD